MLPVHTTWRVHHRTSLLGRVVRGDMMAMGPAFGSVALNVTCTASQPRSSASASTPATPTTPVTTTSSARICSIKTGAKVLAMRRCHACRATDASTGLPIHLCVRRLPIKAGGWASSTGGRGFARWRLRGPGWVGVLLPNAEAVLAIDPDAGVLGGLEVGVIGAHPDGAPEAFEVRAFATGSDGFYEDPVTGSLNVSLGQWLIKTGRAPARYHARQGTRLGKQGVVHIEYVANDL